MHSTLIPVAVMSSLHLSVPTESGRPVLEGDPRLAVVRYKLDMEMDSLEVVCTG